MIINNDVECWMFIVIQPLIECDIKYLKGLFSLDFFRYVHTYIHCVHYYMYHHASCYCVALFFENWIRVCRWSVGKKSQTNEFKKKFIDQVKRIPSGIIPSIFFVPWKFWNLSLIECVVRFFCQCKRDWGYDSGDNSWQIFQPFTIGFYVWLYR